MSNARSSLSVCLADVEFPADKPFLLQAAARGGCDEASFRALQGIPCETYANLSHALAAVPPTSDRLSSTG